MGPREGGGWRGDDVDEVEGSAPSEADAVLDRTGGHEGRVDPHADAGEGGGDGVGGAGGHVDPHAFDVGEEGGVGRCVGNSDVVLIVTVEVC